MKVKLSQAFDLQMGKTPSRNIAEYWGGSHKWVSIADIGNAVKYISATKECITDDGVSGSGIKVVPKGTVIMSFKLSIGKTTITSEDMYTNEAIMAFIDKGIYPVDPNYLYHLCCGTDWTAGTNKAVMGMTLNKATLSEKMIDLPSVEEQKDIVEKLDAVDSLINNQQRQMEKLDELVKSRFVEMFGDLTGNTCRWETCTFDDCFDITSSKRILKSEWKTQGIPFLRVRDMVQLATTGKMDNEFFVSEEFYGSLSDSDGVPKPGDILMSATSTLGKCYVVSTGERFYFKDADVLRFRAKKAINPVFFMEQMKTAYIEKQISRTLGITTVAHFTIKAAKTISIRLPNIELQNQFATFVEQTDKSKLAVKQSLEKLETLKQSLMQQYFG